MPDNRMIFRRLAEIAADAEVRAADRNGIDFEGLTLAEQERRAEAFIRQRMEEHHRQHMYGEFAPEETVTYWFRPLRPPAPVPLPPIDDTRDIVTEGQGVSQRTMERVALEQAAIEINNLARAVGRISAHVTRIQPERTVNLPLRFLDSYYGVAQVTNLPARTVQQLQNDAYAGARGDEIAPPKRHDVMVFMEKIAVAMRSYRTDACTIKTLTIPGRLAQQGFDEVAIYIGNAGEYTVYYDVETDDYFVDTENNMKKKVGYR